MENGATQNEATVTAILASVMNSTLEATKGFETLSEDLKSANTIGDIVRKWVKSSAMEGLEEVIPGITTEAVQMALFDRDKPFLSFDADKNAAFNLPQIAKNGLTGGIIGGIAGMPKSFGKALRLPYDVKEIQENSLKKWKSLKKYFK